MHADQASCGAGTRRAREHSSGGLRRDRLEQFTNCFDTPQRALAVLDRLGISPLMHARIPSASGNRQDGEDLLYADKSFSRKEPLGGPLQRRFAIGHASCLSISNGRVGPGNCKDYASRTGMQGKKGGVFSTRFPGENDPEISTHFPGTDPSRFNLHRLARLRSRYGAAFSDRPRNGTPRSIC